MIKIYTLTKCPSCWAAKRFFDEHNQEYEEINIHQQDISRDRLEELTGGRSVPQILIDSKSIGGFDDLMALEQSGKLQF